MSATQDFIDEVKGCLTPNVNSALIELKNQDNILKSRMDNLSTLEEGSTTGDAELIDTRVGADGTIYPNAGTAVRTQVSELKQDLDNLYNKTDFAENATIENGKYMHKDGVLLDASDSCVTDYIKVEPNTKYKAIKVFLETNRSICLYDDDKVKIITVLYGTSETTVEFTTPNNCEYIRITGAVNVKPELYYADEIINKALDKAINTAEEYTNTILKSKNIAEFTFITDGKYMHKDGVPLDASDSCITDYIMVKPNTKYIAEKVFLSDNRSIVGYKSNKTKIGTILFGGKANVVEFTTPNDCEYIVITGRAGIKPELYYADSIAKVLDEEIYGNIDITPITWEDGYVYILNNEIQHGGVGNGYVNSGYLQVEPYRIVKILNFHSVAYQSLILFDYSKKLIKFIPYESTDVAIPYYEFEVPSNCRYIMFSTKKTYDTKVAYTDSTPTFGRTNSLVKSWVNDSCGKVNKLFDSVNAQGGIITIIDDDTLNLSQIQTFHDCCVRNGIVGTYAVMTQCIVESNTLNTLKEYEEQGFHMAYHCKIQEEYYRMQSDKRDLVQATQNFIKGYQKMTEFGLSDWKFWISPYGSNDADMQALAKKWGMNCLVSIGQKTYESTKSDVSRFNISRVGFNQEDTGSVTFTELKTIIDDAAINNGWVLVGTHMNTWDSSKGYDKFDELVTYAKSKGLKFMTLNEAFRIREPIYRTYETF